MPKNVAETLDPDIPCYGGLAGAVQAARDLGFPGALTEDIVRNAIKRGELRPRVIHVQYWFSRNMVRDWLVNGNKIRNAGRKPAKRW